MNHTSFSFSLLHFFLVKLVLSHYLQKKHFLRQPSTETNWNFHSLLPFQKIKILLWSSSRISIVGCKNWKRKEKESILIHCSENSDWPRNNKTIFIFTSFISNSLGGIKQSKSVKAQRKKHQERKLMSYSTDYETLSQYGMEFHFFIL